MKTIRTIGGEATTAELLRQAIHWEATRAWWHARNGSLETAADAESRATYYAKQYAELPERSHCYVYR